MGRYDVENDFTIKDSYYQWTGYVVGFMERVLRLNVKLHASEAELAAADIILFNHFARFETFIPPYLIYKSTGCMTRSVASPELFDGPDATAALLRGLGAVPADHPHLLPFLAGEIVRGRKVVFFPEGGMVKDRRVLDRKGEYSVYSRSAEERRKHHTGAAFLTHGLEFFKEAIRKARERGDEARLNGWASMCGEDGRELLDAFAQRTISLVPANITFYPIRVDPNLLEQAISMVAGKLDPRLAEELRIEGNILLKDTDMDIRLGERLSATESIGTLDKLFIGRWLNRAESLDDIFEPNIETGSTMETMYAKALKKASYRLRDTYMHEIYTSVSVNLSHIISAVIFRLLDCGVRKLPREKFFRLVYLTLKNAQEFTQLPLHRSAVDPDYYSGVLRGEGREVGDFFESVGKLGLVEVGEEIVFTDALCQERAFDRIRLENPIAVYDNEMRPLGEITKALDKAFEDEPGIKPKTLAELKFHDEIEAFDFDTYIYDKPEYAEINSQQTITEDARPFLMMSKKSTKMGKKGVLLIHGFTASPAEMRPLGEVLAAKGYTVMGVRLKGHATSPWDLRDHGWEDWVESVRRGREILDLVCERVAVVGFSMGGLLGLHHAATRDDSLEGIVSVSAPLALKDRAMMAVPLLHGVNRLVGAVSTLDGVKPFHESEPEHPRINYRHMPIRALYQLDRFISETEDVLGDVACEVLVLQGTGDPTVEPKSADKIYEKLGTEKKTLVKIPTERHGILYEDVGGVVDLVTGFIDRVLKD